MSQYFNLFFHEKFRSANIQKIISKLVMCKLANEKKVLGGGMHNEQCTMHNAQ